MKKIIEVAIAGLAYISDLRNLGQIFLAVSLFNFFSGRTIEAWLLLFLGTMIICAGTIANTIRGKKIANVVNECNVITKEEKL